MTEQIVKFGLLATGGIGSAFLAVGGAGGGNGAESASQWYWVAEKFGLLGVMILGLILGGWIVLPKAVQHLFTHLQKLEDRNEKSREDFLTELRQERTHREVALQGFKDHLENHNRTMTDAIRVQTETLVRELRP